MKELTQIGEEIYRIKKEKKVTLKKIAIAGGITPQHLGYACRGARNLSLNTLHKIAEKYKKKLIVQFIENYDAR